LRASVSRRPCTIKKETPGEAPGVGCVLLGLGFNSIVIKNESHPAGCKQTRDLGPFAGRFWREWQNA
jgi:hypothetical protein